MRKLIPCDSLITANTPGHSKIATAGVSKIVAEPTIYGRQLSPSFPLILRHNDTYNHIVGELLGSNERCERESERVKERERERTLQTQSQQRECTSRPIRFPPFRSSERPFGFPQLLHRYYRWNIVNSDTECQRREYEWAFARGKERATGIKSRSRIKRMPASSKELC